MDKVGFVCADVICDILTMKEVRSLLNDNQFLLLLPCFFCLDMFILLSFWFFIVLRNFIFQIIIIVVLIIATYLITGFYVNSKGSSYNFFFVDASCYSSMEGGRWYVQSSEKNIYFSKGSFCLFSTPICAFVWLLFQIFSMVRFTVNLICFAVNSRLFLCYNKNIS